ncbi:hypothetical protein BDV37DRAFT_237360 [Aspergillus pseudonomiae]|uniref:Uncharacterized protein n=1 Tax=Aspergillus pseudonomiae TaxID=1506151 RepID=A0A5N7DSF8_9EURO|nr:uncharacterized protein BDV37DRAFT_237360 [Aspergillus pseudonomiae]KAE8409372.1 hypothetical protein BDV37DRAFT_237360 [Aspergillus pseudonomiae]
MARGVGEVIYFCYILSVHHFYISLFPVGPKSTACMLSHQPTCDSSIGLHSMYLYISHSILDDPISS